MNRSRNKNIFNLSNLLLGYRPLLIVVILFFSFFLFSNFASANCPPNVIPDPADPNCDGENSTPLGFLNPVIQLWPLVMVFVGIAGVVKTVIALMKAKNADENKEAYKTLSRTGIAVGLGLSIWIILYILEQFFGVKLLDTIGG